MYLIFDHDVMDRQAIDSVHRQTPPVEARDRRLQQLEEEALAYKLETTRTICEVLFPDEVRRPGIELDELA